MYIYDISSLRVNISLPSDFAQVTRVIHVCVHGTVGVQQFFFLSEELCLIYSSCFFGAVRKAIDLEI